MTGYPRTIGALTFAYGAYTLARPQSLVRVSGLEPQTCRASRSGQTLGRVIGARDLMSGLAMVLLQPGPGLRAAVVARVCCDVSDVVGFGLSVPAGSRAKVMAVAALWGSLSALALAVAGDAT